MLKSKKSLISIATIFLVLAVVLNTGCIGQMDEWEAEGTIEFGLPPWPGVTVKTEVARELLEGMGYTTTAAQLDAGIVYAELAEGNIDVLLAGWLPATHGEYWNLYEDRLELVHVNVPETWLGLVVPTYVYEAGIQSITDLPGNEDKFGGTIVGIEPGAGIMINTGRAIDIYGLDGYTLASSSTPAMMAELDAAIEANEWVVATLWKPHSAFAIFDIMELDDPQFVYGEEGDKVYTVLKDGFAEDYPLAYTFFQKFQVSPETQSEWIHQYADLGRDPREIAREWINQNPEKVIEWTT